MIEHFHGTIQKLVADLGVEDIVCMRLKAADGCFPTVTYLETYYSQLCAGDEGRTIVSVICLSLEKLKTMEWGEAYARYCAENGDPRGARLAIAMERYGIKLYLHTLNDGSARLVAAGRLEICQRQSEKFRYWEQGYTYQNAYLDYIVAPVNE